MINKLAFEALDRSLQDVRQCFKLRPFGGILVVLSGEFRHTLPVIRGGTHVPTNLMHHTCGNLWRHIP